MILSRTFALTAVVSLVAVGGVAAVPGEAEAQSISRHRSASINGPHHSASRGADIYRSPGSASVHRYGSVDDHSWSSSRHRDTVRTADGFVTHAGRSGPAGRSRTRSAEVHRDDGQYSRSADLQTSGGRGYQRDVDVRRDDDSVSIDRSITTNGCASRQSTIVRSW
jgi:hypothetical protein